VTGGPGFQKTSKVAGKRKRGLQWTYLNLHPYEIRAYPPGSGDVVIRAGQTARRGYRSSFAGELKVYAHKDYVELWKYPTNTRMVYGKNPFWVCRDWQFQWFGPFHSKLENGQKY
jgi:hypothetical protein